MTRVLTDTGRRVGAYIIGEAAGADGGPGFSREQITLKSGADYVPGMVLGKATSGGSLGKFGPLTEGDATGLQTVAGICYGFYDATAADQRGVASVRRSTVSGHELVWPSTYDAAEIKAGIAALAALGIIVRY